MTVCVLTMPGQLHHAFQEVRAKPGDTVWLCMGPNGQLLIKHKAAGLGQVSQFPVSTGDHDMDYRQSWPECSVTKGDQWHAKSFTMSLHWA